MCSGSGQRSPSL